VTRTTHVIVGGGLAAARAAKAMRDKSFDGRIVIVAAEPHPPYDRPPLSKSVLLGAAPLESTRLLAPEFFREKEIELRLGAAAESIDRRARCVRLQGGDVVAYDKLLIATGARARRLAMPGSDLDGVFYLRGLDDCAALGAALRADAAVAIVGGGYIGLEVAASARKRGCRVCVLDAQGAVLSRIAAPDVAAWFEELHRANGVAVHTGVAVAGLGGKGGRVDHVFLSDGSRIAADVVVIGVGAVPNVELAAAAGLPVENGIAVDDQARTADPDIFAAGDTTVGILAERAEPGDRRGGGNVRRRRALCGGPVVLVGPVRRQSADYRIARRVGPHRRAALREGALADIRLRQGWSRDRRQRTQRAARHSGAAAAHPDQASGRSGSTRRRRAAAARAAAAPHRILRALR
jgi:NADPH-dependent 2,4-dienoyl-CoA reductase/sulfur reductase-like enzyme